MILGMEAKAYIKKVLTTGNMFCPLKHKYIKVHKSYLLIF